MNYSVRNVLRAYPFHLVSPSPWPLSTSVYLLNTTIGALFLLAFFYNTLSPTTEPGANWPPMGIQSINPFELPLWDTIIVNVDSTDYMISNILLQNRFILGKSINNKLPLQFLVKPSDRYVSNSSENDMEGDSNNSEILSPDAVHNRVEHTFDKLQTLSVTIAKHQKENALSQKVLFNRGDKISQEFHDMYKEGIHNYSDRNDFLRRLHEERADNLATESNNTEENEGDIDRYNIQRNLVDNQTKTFAFSRKISEHTGEDLTKDTILQNHMKDWNTLKDSFDNSTEIRLLQIKGEMNNGLSDEDLIKLESLEKKEIEASTMIDNKEKKRGIEDLDQDLNSGPESSKRPRISDTNSVEHATSSTLVGNNSKTNPINLDTPEPIPISSDSPTHNSPGPSSFKQVASTPELAKGKQIEDQDQDNNKEVSNASEAGERKQTEDQSDNVSASKNKSVIDYVIGIESTDIPSYTDDVD